LDKTEKEDKAHN